MGRTPPAACRLLLGHTKLGSTVPNLCIDVDDALELSEQIELMFPQARRAPAARPRWGV